MSNIFLNKIGYGNIAIYSGCYSCDNIPKFVGGAKAFIINLSSQNSVGTHFTALVISAQKELIFFDSFGQPCTNKHILSFMSTVSDRYMYNKIAVQHHLSIYCGLFSLGFIVEYNNKNGNLDTYLNEFSTTSMLDNDQRVVEYITKHI